MGALMLQIPVPPTGQKDVHWLVSFELLPNSALLLADVPLVHCVQSLIVLETVPLLCTLDQTS